MQAKLGHPLDCKCLGRRRFLKRVGGAAVAGIAGSSLFLADQVRADALSKEMREKLTREQAAEMLVSLAGVYDPEPSSRLPQSNGSDTTPT